MSERVLVVGDGGWGTALALLLLGKGHTVSLWGAFPDYVKELQDTRENSKFLPGFPLPETLLIGHDLSEMVKDASVVVITTPSHALREVCGLIAPVYSGNKIIVSASKGVENGTLLRMSQVISEVISTDSVVALSGPSHAEEVARCLPSTIVAASCNIEYARRIQKLFMTEKFRVYTNPDIIGVELGGALKNIIAIAAGICDGLGLGSNTKAALLTRGLAEIRRLGVAMGADPGTFAGLSGIGDLITTCISSFGRNRGLGLQLAGGEKLSEILETTEMVMEGVKTTQSAYDLSERYTIEMPITRQIHAVLYEDKKPETAVRDLMMRSPKPEMEHWGV